MTMTELRLKLLELTRPQSISFPDGEMWIAQARRLEAYVAEGQAIEPLRNGAAGRQKTQNRKGQRWSRWGSVLASVKA